MPDEESPLISHPRYPRPLPGFLGSEGNCKGLGFVVTCAAILPQGLLGMVLWDNQLAGPYFIFPVRIGTDVCIMVGSIVGKLMIVYYFNGPKWAEFAHPDWRIFNPRSWTVAGLANTIQTIPISTFFGWLASAGCIQAADIIRSYGSNFFGHIADIVGRPYFYGPFCAVALGTNLVSFRPIHSGAVALMKGAALELAESPEYKKLKQEFCYDILETVRMHLKNLYDRCRAKNDYNEYIAAVQQILTIPDGEELVAQSATHIDRAKLITFARNLGESEKAPHVGWLEWGFNKFTTGAATALVIAGVYNFYDLTQQFMTQLICGGYIFGGDAYGSSSSSSSACPAGETLAGQTAINLYAAMVLLSMSGMALCVMKGTTHKLSRRFFGRPPLNVLSTCGTIANAVWSGGNISFGAAPNTQQAFMAHLRPELIALAPASSMGYEGTGVFDVTEEYFISHKDWQEQLAHYIDKALQFWQGNISYEDVRAFECGKRSDEEVQAIPETPRYSGWFQSVGSFFGQTKPPIVSANIDTNISDSASPAPGSP